MARSKAAIPLFLLLILFTTSCTEFRYSADLKISVKGFFLGNPREGVLVQLFYSKEDAQDLFELQTMNAQAFGSVINAYDPQAIVIMGSVGLNQFQKIIPPSKLIERYTINRPIPPIIKCKMGGDIGMLGAFYAGQQYLSESATNE